MKKCPICSRYVGQSKFANHIRQHNQTKKEKICQYCKYPTPQNNFLRHEQRCKKTYKYIDFEQLRCQICGMQCKTRIFCLIHVSKNHPQQTAKSQTFEIGDNDDNGEDQIEDTEADDALEIHDLDDFAAKDWKPIITKVESVDFLKKWESLSDVDILITDDNGQVFQFRSHKVILAMKSPKLESYIQLATDAKCLKLYVNYKPMIELLRFVHTLLIYKNIQL